MADRNPSSLDALDEIPDPAARIAARVPPPPRELTAPSPTRAERTLRIRIAAALAVAWVAAVVLRAGVRHNIDTPRVMILLAAWSALVAVGLAIALLPRERGLPPGVRAVQLALAAMPAIWLATVLVDAASAPPVELTWRSTGGCMTLANVIALGPLLATWLLIRRAFPSAPILRGAAVGAAAGLLGAIGVHAHCTVAAGSHVIIAHGAPLLVGALAGAALGAIRGRT